MINASNSLNLYIMQIAERLNIHLSIGNIYSTDVFYKENDNYKDIVEKYGCVACEMESFALFHNAKILNKRAACLLTISNSFVTGEETSSEEREKVLRELFHTQCYQRLEEKLKAQLKVYKDKYDILFQ